MSRHILDIAVNEKWKACGFLSKGRMKKNIFEKLVTSENDFTNLLVNMLVFPEVKKAFAFSFLGPEVDFDPMKVTSQFVTNENGNPDVFYTDGSLTFILEVKTEERTGLQPTQPTSYLKILEAQSGTKVLGFLVPGSYHHLEILRNRCKGRDIRIVTWEELIMSLAELTKSPNPILNHFYDHISKKFKFYSPEFSVEDLMYQNSRELARYMKNTRQAILNIKKRLQNENCSTKSEFDEDNFGFFINDSKSGENLFWFGIFNNLWFETGVMVSVLANEVHKYAHKFRSRNMFEEGKNTYYYDFLTLHDLNSLEDEYFKLILDYLGNGEA